ncbi:MAG: polyprenol phosphomannose-dependent alpha 1,6 mannosyltransferase MptB [Sphaerobacter sp.]|nr:polyprenol phosphomannose-dependent alpha 1,6 mannosyltransferase MptB [Sphaerobacter sp.]
MRSGADLFPGVPGAPGPKARDETAVATARGAPAAATPPQAQAQRRALVTGGAALSGILVLLTGVTVETDPLAPALVKLQEIARNARLFAALVPHVASLPVLHYAVFAWGCVLALWLVYLRLIWQVRGAQLDVRLIASGAVLLGLLAMTIPPVFSTDVFSYAAFGRLAGVYDVNPYLSTPAQGAATDPVLPYLYWRWREISSPYGPLWTVVSELVTLGRHATPLELVIRFKLVALAAVLAAGWLIYRLVRHRWPAQASWAYLAFAWNPMVLVEGVVTGHNDVFILAIVLVSAYLLLRARPHLAFAGLMTSSLVKYSTAPLLGVTTLRLLLRTPPPRRLGLLLRLSAIAVVLLVAAFAPYWGGLDGLMSTIEEPGRGVNNPVMVAARGLVTAVTAGHVQLGVPATVVISLGAFLLWQGWALGRTGQAGAWGAHDELASWATSLTVFLLLWPRIHTWYFVVPLGLALAAGPPHRRLFGVVLVASLLSYASYAL